MKSERIDLVHANCYPANKLAGPAAKSLGIPCVWHKQIAVTQKPGSSTARLWKFFSRYNAAVIAVSQQGLRALKAFGIPGRKLHLLYNNADTRHMAASKKLKKPPSRWPIVLAAGIVLIMAPHVIGAPHAGAFTSTAPAELAGHFTSASLAVHAVLWLLVGATSGYFWQRFNSTQT